MLKDVNVVKPKDKDNIEIVAGLEVIKLNCFIFF